MEKWTKKWTKNDLLRGSHYHLKVLLRLFEIANFNSDGIEDAKFFVEKVLEVKGEKWIR